MVPLLPFVLSTTVLLQGRQWYGKQCLLSVVLEGIEIMSSAMTPPCGPTGGPEGECFRLKEALLGVSSKSYSEGRKLIIKSAKNFP